MNYPLISEYIEAIKAAEENFDELKNLRPVLDEDGEPVMTSGNFAVVFKMKNEQTGKLHAVKCFLKEQEGRAEAYRMIAEELENVNSTFLTPIKYLDKELFVDSKNSDETEFPVLLMDWVEGMTLDKYIREHIDDLYELSLLAYQFSRLAMWLMPHPFAHGDLKPDNILVKDDGTLVLVDYDGMYVPAMKGQKARELGSPDFRHPSRTENDFDEHIDDFSLASILLSLKAISLQPSLLEEYGASDRLLFSEKDYRNLSDACIWKVLTSSEDSELNNLLSVITAALQKNYLSTETLYILCLKEPEKNFFIEGNIPQKLLWKMGLDKYTIICEGIASVFNGHKWGCLNKDGVYLIPCLYDLVSFHKYDDNKNLILCASGGDFFTGIQGGKERTIYTGSYDLYDTKGNFLLGGFNDYEYHYETSTYRFLYGRKWKLFPKKSNYLLESNRFHIGKRGKWIILNQDLIFPFDCHLQYVDRITGYWFTSKHSLEGGRLYLKDDVLYGEFKGYSVPIKFPNDVLFDKISIINTTTFLGINHPNCANEEQSVIYMNKMTKSSYYEWTETIDEHYTFVYRGKLGLLKDGKEVLPCEFEYITKPINNWVFIVKKYPYIPDERTWGKCYVLLYQIKDSFYSDYQFRTSVIAIKMIDKEYLEQLLYQGAFKLQKVGADSTNIKSYALIENNSDFFEKGLLDQLHKPLKKEDEYYYNYWQSCDLMKLMRERKKKNYDEQDNYGLMDALDGDPEAYWNID